MGAGQRADGPHPGARRGGRPGKFELASALLFDLGVFLAVVGTVLVILTRNPGLFNLLIRTDDDKDMREVAVIRRKHQGRRIRELNLPGDIRIARKNFTCVFALGTSILLSILLTIGLNLLARLLNR